MTFQKSKGRFLHLSEISGEVREIYPSSLYLGDVTVLGTGFWAFPLMGSYVFEVQFTLFPFITIFVLIIACLCQFCASQLISEVITGKFSAAPRGFFYFLTVKVKLESLGISPSIGVVLPLK